MLRKTIELNTANGAAFFALGTHGKFSPTTKRVCGITDASMSVGCGVGGGATFFLNKRRFGRDGIFVGRRLGANEGPASTETCKAPGVLVDGSNDVIEKDVVGSTVTEERKRLWPNSTSEVGAWAKPNA